jgi:uncharacterized protein (TIGR00369 family)
MSSGEKIDQQMTTRCFGCGPDNPIGLKLRFRPEGGMVVCDFNLSDLYAGYPGFMHGGVIFSVLDEAMGWAVYCLCSGTLAITAKAEVRFLRPAPTGENLRVTAEVVDRTRKLVTAKAAISRGNGVVVADSTATMVVS